jgi:glycosyltransferase involved in cell wall biosynthesis
VYGNRRLQPFLAVLDDLRKNGNDIVFEQIGNVSRQDELIAFVQERCLQGAVTFCGHQPHDVLLRRMAAADAFLLLQPGTALQVPSKLFEMLLFRKPILAIADRGATAQLIEKYKLGVVVGQENPQQIADAIVRIAHSALQYQQNDSHLAALSEFDGRCLTGRLAAIFNDLRGSARRSLRPAMDVAPVAGQ